jgi:hypothetical protein
MLATALSAMGAGAGLAVVPQRDSVMIGRLGFSPTISVVATENLVRSDRAVEVATGSGDGCMFDLAAARAHRLPVDTGRLHRDVLAARRPQPVRELQKPDSPRAQLRPARTPACTPPPSLCARPSRRTAHESPASPIPPTTPPARSPLPRTLPTVLSNLVVRRYNPGCSQDFQVKLRNGLRALRIHRPQCRQRGHLSLSRFTSRR